MPTYGYQCKDCKNEFSVFQSMKDDPITVCPTCSGSVKRLLYPVGIVFKGSGWYVNDSRKPEPSESSTASADKKDSSSDGDGAKADAKTDGKTESATASKSTATDTKADSKATTPASA